MRLRVLFTTNRSCQEQQSYHGGNLNIMRMFLRFGIPEHIIQRQIILVIVTVMRVILRDGPWFIVVLNVLYFVVVNHLACYLSYWVVV